MLVLLTSNKMNSRIIFKFPLIRYGRGKKLTFILIRIISVTKCSPFSAQELNNQISAVEGHYISGESMKYWGHLFEEVLIFVKKDIYIFNVKCEYSCKAELY